MLVGSSKPCYTLVQRTKKAHHGRRVMTAAVKTAPRTDAKSQLLELIKPLNRGVGATEEQKIEVDKAAQKLEKLNPTRATVTSPLLNGKWKLIYTTSESILGSKRPPFLRPLGPIFQILDNENLRARNQETWPFFNSVVADLTPVNAKKVTVQFRTFRIFGLIPITAPPSAKGELETTYLDEELRVSRGDKGNLFVLIQTDPNTKP